MQQLNMPSLQKKRINKLLLLRLLLNKTSIVILLLLLLLFTNQASTRSQTISQGLETKTLVVHSESGRHIFTVKIADTDAKRSLGLKFIKSLLEDSGMLFTYEYPQEVSFWMQDTYTSLDIIFIDKDNKIIRIEALAQPLSEKSIPSRGKVIAVLEINGGLSWKKGIKIGDLVEF